jgi:hypothetical protein
MLKAIKCTEEHLSMLNANKFELEKCPKLNNVINPIMLKLTKQEDSHGMGSLGPFLKWLFIK